jgi:hypothetical protein
MAVPNSTLSPKAVNGTLGFLIAGTLVNVLTSTIPYLHDNLSLSVRDQLTVLIAAGIGFYASWKSKHKPTVNEIVAALDTNVEVQSAMDIYRSGGAVVPRKPGAPPS